MINTTLKSSNHPLAAYIERLKAGGALLLILNKCARGSWHSSRATVVLGCLLPESPTLLSINFSAFPLQYFNGEVTSGKLLRHWWY